MNTFQSAPVVADGRCMQRVLRSEGLLRVSIRARRCRRAMLGMVARVMQPGVFQSAPVVADGRCDAKIIGGWIKDGFNPRPSLPTGDAPNLGRETGQG